MAGRIYDAQQQHLQENHGYGSDPKSWFSGDDLRDTISSLTTAAATASATGNVDLALYTDLVEILPLVQSLIDRKANTSFTKRGSMIYTKTPSKDSIYKKAAKKNRIWNSESDQNGGSENFSIVSSNAFLDEKEREELILLRDQVQNLRTQLSEKDELLNLAEISKNEVATLCVKLEELQNETAQKDLVIRSTQSQISDAKIKLADKQAAVEKLQWEVSESNRKSGKLEEDIEALQREFSDIISLIQGLTRTELVPLGVETCYEIPCFLDEDDESDFETKMVKMEAAREGYITAVNAAKEKQDEETIAEAAAARFYLHSIVTNEP